MTNIKSGYIVCQVLGYGALQPVFSTEEYLDFFDTMTEANAAIQEAINDVSEAISEGHMSKNSRMKKSDYEIVPAVLNADTNEIIAYHKGDWYIMHRTADDWVKI